MTRHTIHYSGRVQGVGFRYTVQRIARNHAVAGYVQNLPDGRVRLIAEGDEATLTAFEEEIAQAMQGYIRNSTCEVSPATGEFGDATPGALTIRY